MDMKRYRKKDLLQIVSTFVQVNDSITRTASSTALFDVEEKFAFGCANFRLFCMYL